MSAGGERWIRCPSLLTPFEQRSDMALHIAGGTIRAVVPAAAAGAPLEEAGAATVAPGFIDLHVHGARGHDVMEGTRAALEALSAALAAHGTTAFLATTLSAPDADTEHALRGYARHAAALPEGARPIGIHMEGPYLNPVRRGAHNASYLRAADLQGFRRFLEISDRTVRKLTLAPEMDAGLAVTREAAARGIQVSLGHSDATLEEARAAVEAGARHATHVFNAMRPLHHREPGILGLVLSDDRIFAEAIADGVHVHDDALRLLLRAKGVERTVLVTDGLSAVDMPEGSYPLGDQTVLVAGGACRDAAGNLAGSVLTLDRAVRNLVTHLGVAPTAAVTAATATPARSMGLDHKGRIAPGCDADLVFLDGDLRVRRTMVAGRVVFQA